MEPAKILACKSFAPIHWRDADTDATIREVKAHNAAWLKVCGNQK